jgi:transmembrane sensor
MKPYEHYTIEDFLQDEDFRDWVQGLSPRETFWLSFLHHYPAQQEAMQQAEHMVRATHLNEEVLSEKEIRAEVNTFLLHAGSDSPFASLPSGKSPFRQFRFGRMASVAALILAVFGLAWNYGLKPRGTSGAQTTTTGHLVQTTNPTQQPLRLLLSDSTEVLLSPNSSLSYPSRFADQARVVYLSGQAIFSVTHRHQPFMVRTGEMVTKVLGTRFVVSAYENEEKMTVQVLSGKVSVYRKASARTTSKKEVSGLILTVNQAAIFEKDQRQLTKTLVADPTLVLDAPLPAEVRYDEVPLPLILHDLERSYGIAMQFHEPSLRPCKITATLSSGLSLFEKLDLLCKTIAATYEIVDGQIVINTKGCQ